MVLAYGRQLELWKDAVAPECCILPLVVGFRGFVPAQSGFWSSLGIHFPAFFSGHEERFVNLLPRLGPHICGGLGVSALAVFFV